MLHRLVVHIRALALVQLRHEASLGKQPSVFACLYNISVLHHKDEVRVADGGQAVGNDKAGRCV